MFFIMTKQSHEMTRKLLVPGGMRVLREAGGVEVAGSPAVKGINPSLGQALQLSRGQTLERSLRDPSFFLRK